MSGLPYSTVNSLLRGKSDSPNLKTLIRIATAFNMTIVEFLDVPEIIEFSEDDLEDESERNEGQEETNKALGRWCIVENKYAHSDFDSFYLEYSPKLWRLAYRLTRNRYDSEDLVDEAFLIYLQKSITMVIDNPEAYITRILANLVRNYARLSWHNELPIDVLPESTLSTDGVGMRLREVLPKGLSPQEQEILLLRFEERLSYSEIADVLKIKEVSCR